MVQWCFFAVGGYFKSNLSLGICEEVRRKLLPPIVLSLAVAPRPFLYFWRGDMATSLQLESSRKGSLDGILPKNVKQYSPEN